MKKPRAPNNKVCQEQKRCYAYHGVACVDGRCPIERYHKGYTLFDKEPNCKSCYHYKGCKDCYFKNTIFCVRDDYDRKVESN